MHLCPIFRWSHLVVVQSIFSPESCFFSVWGTFHWASINLFYMFEFANWRFHFLLNIIQFASGELFFHLAFFPSVQFSHSVMSGSSRPHESQHARPPLSITISRSSLRLTSIESMMPSSHLILCRPLLLLPPIPPSIRVFFNESTLCMRWPKYWSLSFSIIPSKEIPGLISFRMD